MDKSDIDNAIGIFDSGIGGLTVLHSIRDHLPSEDTIYLGDTARVPYGTKSARIVTQYAMEIGAFLIEMNVKALVVACNTASAVALESLEKAFAVPVIGMIDPAVKKAVEVTTGGCIGIIGTEGTIRSGAYEKAIKEVAPESKVFNKACPLLVPLAEEGWIDNDVAFKTVEIYLEKLVGEGVDTLILGCTHYPLLRSVIRKVVGNDVSLVDCGEEASLVLKGMLGRKVEGKPVGSAVRKYFVTDTPDRFIRVGERFLGEPIRDVSHVDIP